MRLSQVILNTLLHYTLQPPRERNVVLDSWEKNELECFRCFGGEVTGRKILQHAVLLTGLTEYQESVLDGLLKVTSLSN